MKIHLSIYVLSTLPEELSMIGKNDQVKWNGMMGSAGGVGYTDIASNIGGSDPDFRVGSVGYGATNANYISTILSEIKCNCSIGLVG